MSVFTKIRRWFNEPYTDIKIERPLYNEQVDTKVMRVLMGKLRHTTDLDVWLSHNYDSGHWLPILDAQQKKIDAIRDWAHTLPRGAARSSYFSWLTYYFEWGLKEARKELNDQSIRRSQEQYSARLTKLGKGLENVEVPEP